MGGPAAAFMAAAAVLPERRRTRSYGFCADAALGHRPMRTAWVILALALIRERRCDVSPRADQEGWPEEVEVDVLAVAWIVRTRRRTWCAVLDIMALILLEPGAARAEPGVPDPPNGLLSDRGVGALSAADKDFVVKVRLAGLWEIPAGEMAQQKSDDARIKSIGRDIAGQHVALDKLVRDAAKKLKIALPNKPNSDQQTWLAEMRDAEGEDFDRVYIDRLRAAHGKIFPAIATIRASTRNDTVRKLAQRTNQFVMTHLTLLESSGLVDFAALPTAPPPAPVAGRTSSAAPALSAVETSQTPPSSNLPLLLVVVAAGLGAALFATKRLLQDPRRRYRRPRARYYEP